MNDPSCPAWADLENGLISRADWDAAALPSYWARRANDMHLPLPLRAAAVAQLIRRYAHPGMAIGQLGNLLDRPCWLTADAIELVECYMGKLPVWETRGRDSVYHFQAFTEHDSCKLIMYLRVAGHVPQPELARLLLGESENHEIAGRPVVDIALFFRGKRWIYWPEGRFVGGQSFEKW